MSFHHHAADRRAPHAGAVAPASAKFGFWRSMYDLGRLVMRSKAKGLRVRLGVALGLVLLGKWTGVYAPLLLGQAVDHLSVGRTAQATAGIAFAGLALGWVLLRFISNAAPYARDSIFTPVSQMALARSAVESFAHALSLSLDFHQSKQTGGLARIIDRGARSTDFLLRSVVFNLGPSLIELLMACYILQRHFSGGLAWVALGTIAVYIVLTFALSNWRIGHRRALNEADSQAAGLAVDALMNFETIKTFGSEARMVEQYERAMTDFAQAGVKANTSLQLLNTVQSVVLSLGLGLMTLLAGLQVAQGRMQIGGVMACILILQTVYAPLNILGMLYREIRQAFIDMEQMLTLTAVRPDIADAPGRSRFAAGLRARGGDRVRACIFPAQRALPRLARCQFPDTAGRHHGSGRAIRRGQDHYRAVGASAARSARGKGVDRWGRSAPAQTGRTAPRRRPGAAGCGPVQRHPVRQYRLWPSRRHRGRNLGRRRSRRTGAVHRGAARADGHPRGRARP